MMLIAAIIRKAAAAGKGLEGASLITETRGAAAGGGARGMRDAV